MTNYEITQMARDAGLMPTVLVPWAFELNKFARLVAAKEREACAKVAKQISDKYAYGYYGNEVDTADEIEAAIRARGEA